MNVPLDSVIAILSLVSSVALIGKGIKRKSLSILLGPAAARLYLFIAVAVRWMGIEMSLPSIHLAVIYVFMSDVLANILSNVIYVEKQKIDNKLMETCQGLRQKYLAIVENALVGIYTINMNGTIEYVNPYLAKLLGYSRMELENRNFFDLLGVNRDCLENFKEDLEIIKCKIRTKDGLRDARIVGHKTVNGHETITGSIYLY